MAAASKFAAKPRPHAVDARAPITPFAHARDLPSRTLCSMLAIGALVVALQEGDGRLLGDAITWLGVAVAVIVMGLFTPASTTWQQRAARCVPWVALVTVVYAFYMWPFTRPALYVQNPTPAMVTVYRLGLASAAVLSGLSLSPPKWLARAHLPALLITYALLGHWILQCSPSPIVDVVSFHKESLAALLQGDNPYAMTLTHIYPDAHMYPDGLVQNGRLLFGYMYPPVNLLLALPAYLCGDYRYAMVAANLVSGALIALLARPREDGEMNLGLACAALFLFTPRALLVLENGWIEPFVIMLLLVTLYTSLKAPKFLPYALGLLLVSKQYVVVLMASAYHLPAMRDMLADKRALRDFATRMVGTAAVVTAPFFLWDPVAFWHSVVTVPAVHPFRADALDFPAWYYGKTKTMLPTSVGFIAAAVASFATWRLLPRTLAGFAYAFATILLFFIAFNRQAFYNYYFLILAALCAAAALGTVNVATPRKSAVRP